MKKLKAGASSNPPLSAVKLLWQNLELNHQVNRYRINIPLSINQMVIPQGGKSHRIAVW